MSVADAIQQACGYHLKKPIVVVKREQFASMAIQGVGYSEDGEVKLDLADLTALHDSLLANKAYEFSAINPSKDEFISYKEAKHRKTCSIDSTKITLTYNLNYW